MGEIKANLIEVNLSQGVIGILLMVGSVTTFVSLMRLCRAMQYSSGMRCLVVGVSYCFDTDKPRGSDIEAVLKYLPSHHAYRNK